MNLSSNVSANKSVMHALPLHVLHIIDHLSIGGAQMLLVDICTQRGASSNRIAHEVLTLYGNGVHAERLRQAGVTVRSLAASKRDMPAILLRLAAHLTRCDYQILHLHLPVASLLGATLGAMLSRSPTFVTVYALKEQLPWPTFRLFRLIAPVVDVFVSLWDNTDLRSVGVGSEKIRTIPIGINLRGAEPQRHKEVRHTLCEQYGFGPERPLLLSVARLNTDRRIHVLLDGMIDIVAACPHALLLMVGDGAERASLEAIVQERCLQNNVIFAGVRTDIWELFPGCDIYLSASGQCDVGVAALQAMACARPVVTYTLGCMEQAQILCEDQGVFLQTRDAQALAQATLELIGTPDRAEQLGQRARAQVLRHFSFDAMVDRYDQLYQEYT
jgi:glycosyltransferase involved in cell wall biosynthesis